ncbi:transglycosylase-like protein with SLT domain [Arcicella aurantiaca]|uniref:Transglycosylase-like protein with SLT domain n=1 Tax=Arcicella aurantiaca TaxID=591202 RepID=A0A316E8D9_9BACT|nr:transglycosylase SLT domain-containing protein [Arcicella aurantiaca]PWK27023.1 transglycosylase-like protein with SLT domain [Arcicella aurantiaca]
MNKVIKGFLILFSVIVIALGSWYFINQSTKKADLSTDNYTPDDKLIAEIKGRVWEFAEAQETVISQGINGSPDIVSFSGGSFPMTKIVEKRSSKDKPTKFDATERANNKVLIQKLIDKHGTLVKQASERFSIPALYIYVVMSVENTEGKTNYVSPGGFVGLMQIDTSSAADTLTTQKKRKLLTVSDLQFFQKKLGSITQVSKNALKDAETNINAGALHLSEMIVDNKFDVVKDIHKIFFSYNRGKNRMDNDGTKALSLDGLINRYLGTVHTVGAEYLIRALGPHGAADILVNDLGITS